VSARFSAAELAEALGGSPPTAQQSAIIEAPLGPALVIAGAGSGKTETMAGRVVWLLANGLVPMSGVLGLTFTRKAAAELAARVRLRIDQLARAGILRIDADPLAAPTVSTYNSFANTLFREHALAIGREPDATVVTDASAWQLARAVVARSTDPRLVELERGVDDVTQAVLTLGAALAENAADPAGVERFVAEFAGLAELPSGRAGKSGYASVAEAVRTVSALPVLVDLAQEVAAEKARRGLVEYSDQVALALQVAERVPGVPAELRERYPVVLLDEYQDTSVVQTRLLARLFGDTAVMAVGDPHQSIYGWRGASAANLARFPDDFAARPAEVARFALSTSWRNPARVLDAANLIAAPLVAGSPVPVERLEPRPGARPGSVEGGFGETVLDEAAAIAAWFARELPRPAPGGGARTAALLCRTLKGVGVFTEALVARGIPVHVLGLGGLLEQPVVADLVSALRVLADPAADPELLRLLCGARWRIGARDIAALSAVASWLAARDAGLQQLDDEVARRLRRSIASGESRSLVDALDFVASAPEGHTVLRDFSPEGVRRLRRAGAELAELRSRSGLHLPDLVTLVVQRLLLDIEVAANESSGLGQASLDEFFEQLQAYLSIDATRTDARGDLVGFLSWLDEAERRENLAPRADAPETGTVQVLTIHGSKGLEWDLVAIPRLVVDELPAPPRSRKGWLSFGQLPSEFRGDAAELPVLAWRSCTTQQEFDRALQGFQEQVARQAAEEQRRLGYVALTRAREALLLTGSFWWTQTQPRLPGAFLREIAAAGLLPGVDLPGEAPDGDNPLEAQRTVREWPLDPLGARRDRVVAAATAVRTADPEAVGSWDGLIRPLLAERAAREESVGRVPLPTRIAASRFHDFVADPTAAASALRRPLPERPYRATRLGTAFHSWVEHRAGVSGSVEELDAEAVTLADPDMAELADLERLQAVFERSEFAGLRPDEVELEIHFVLDGQIVVCKIDAVYRLDDGRYRIVDWKTGRAPATEPELEAKQLQLALYRQAFAELRGLEPDDIDAVFYYVADDVVIRPRRILSRSELVDLWREVA
jgi:DNA helicase-2/ATP-dependent DNA helicase PcrA